jgi:threonine/homoserine/homoserine lactone efflux protein
MFPWISFLSYLFIVAYTPGPNNIMSMNNAKNVGFKKGILFNLGIFAGISVVMIVCLIFSTILYTAIPKIQLPMKIAGAAYMVYLIIKALVPAKVREIKNRNGSFIIGALLQLINPKLIIYGITAISSYIIPYYKEIPILIAFAFLLSFIGFTGTICWALFGSLFSIVFNRHGKILNIVMAILLLYCAVSLFL